MIIHLSHIATIVVIVWATIILFSDVTMLYSELEIGVKAIALISLLYLASRRDDGTVSSIGSNGVPDE